LKRILLFVLTNVMVVAVLGVVASLLGVNRFISESGLNLTALLGFALVMGFGGAIISLLISKPMAKWTSGLHMIDNPQTPDEAWIVGTVRKFADKAGIGMPEVGIFEGEPNAFATGAFKNSSLVAVSTGLLANMTREEVEAVIGHEVAHVANGDMVTMTLIQGVLNTFVFFLARVAGRAIDAMISGSRDNDGPSFFYYIIVFALDIVFGMLASVVAMWFSRWREFRADAGGATLAGRNKMIAALERLAQNHGQSTLPKQVAAFGISGGNGSGLRRLLMSHPPLDERIAALRNAQLDGSQVRQGVVA
jgi:heat shock protein HtpX